MMLARWFSFVCSASVVFCELCVFPSDHPIQGLENGGAVPVEVMQQNLVYVYTDRFGMSCIGCVRKINFCYRPHSNNNLLMTIEIRNNGGTVVDSYDVTVNSAQDTSTNCAQRYSLNAAYCCVEQTLTQSLVVDSQTRHYALRIPNTASLLLRHSTETANGNLEDRFGNTMQGSVYKPLFYFTIDTSDSNCSNTITTAPTSSTDTTELPTSTDVPPGNSQSPSTSSSTIKPSITTDPPPGDPTKYTGTISSRPTSTSSSSKTTLLPDKTDGPIVEAGARSRGNNSPTAAIAGVIVTLLVIIILLVIVVVVIVIFMKKRQRKVIVKHVGEDAGGINNIVYGAAGTEKMAVSLSSVTQSSNTYEGWTEAVQQKNQYEYIEELPSQTYEQATPYTYATPHGNGQVLDTSYAAVGAESSNGKRPSLHYEVEEIYQAPASNETGLYAQYEKINIATIPKNSIRVTECLGSGQFGMVNKGVWQRPTSTLDVAIKTLKSSAKEEDKVKFLQEGAIMGQFKHPNVVRLHGIVREQEAVLLVIELLAKEDLREHLLTLRPKEGESVDENLKHMLLSYCRQVISGLAYLAKKGFVHRDIAARNILLSEDHENCKIADFGMSRDLADETYYISTGGKIPVKWTAPEALHYKKYLTASDVWSFGCLMYEIWSLGHKPFEAQGNAQAIKMVDEGYRLPPPPGCPRAIYQLMIACWNPTASERPSADTASQTLSKSDPVLLKWEVTDKPAGVPQALHLGAPLNSTTLLYPELQTAYLPTNNDYEDTD